MIERVEKDFAALFDRTIAPERFEKLTQWIEADPGNARQFVAWSMLEEQMHDLLGGDQRLVEQLLGQFDAPEQENAESGETAVFEALVTEAITARRQAEMSEKSEHLLKLQYGESNMGPVAESSPKSRRIEIPKWLAYAAAFVFCACVLLLILQGVLDDKGRLTAELESPKAGSAGSQVNDLSPRFAATVIDQNSPQWSSNSLLPDEHGALRPGRYILENGFVRVSFGGVVDSILHSPAQFSIDPDTGMEVIQGKVWSSVSQEGHGFTVTTPTGRFVDLGTDFGVEVLPSGRSSVHVKKGHVEAYTKYSDESNRPTDILDGQAIEITEDGRSIKPVVALPESFATDWEQATIDLTLMDGFKYLHAPPPSLEVGRVEHDQKLYIFKERAGIHPAEPFNAEIQEPGTYDYRPATQQVTLDPAVPVDSYLIHYDPVGAPQYARVDMTKTIQFEQPILAILVSRGTLNMTDGPFGAPQTRYEKSTLARGLELASDDSKYKDEIFLSTDRKTLVVIIRTTNGLDQMRVITRSK
ncbi:MAG: FecR domain-containing protein [Phycisphaeraceae bacterium]